ncbi:uncharacterized protein BXZ73DRAFT_43405 [Epithele typhae]|uniref:uncharacterized protein n=1 Tax=Epithele typhae TaxID=378194 RepID=UPI0020086BF9|nr:uncharacterized protein BXZ73DRAFT_43405 [Epithele typhae]KAH9939794.1 hypothetical protein BXZ73DRAFT_43405 [Epithele typhae]
MHELLLNDDILLPIVELLNIPEGPRPTLVAFSEVCRGWNELASVFLWSHLSTMRPLWGLLVSKDFTPRLGQQMSDFWQSTDAKETVNSIVQNDPDHWRRFLELASHVREAMHMANDTWELNLIRTVSRYNGNKTFLPSLRRLTWRHHLSFDATLLCLCSPTLTSLDIIISMNNLLDVSEPGPSLETTMDGLSEAAPSLYRLTISGTARQTSTTVLNLSRLSNLQELCLTNRTFALDPSHMRAILEGITGITVLTARVIAFDIPNLPQINAPSSLKHICILPSHARDILPLIASFIHPPALTALDVHAEDQTYDHRSVELVEAIAAASFAPNLRALSVVLASDYDPSPSTAGGGSALPSFSEAIMPLLALHALEEVLVRIENRVVAVGDADLRELATAWPRLTSIALMWPPVGPRAQPPVAALHHFATHCPMLRKMSVTKLAVGRIRQGQILVGKETAMTEQPKGSHPLETLKVRFVSGHEEDGSEVARFVHRLFPSLVISEDDGHANRRVSFVPWRSEETNLRWRTVEQEILLYSDKI